MKKTLLKKHLCKNLKKLFGYTLSCVIITGFTLINVCNNTYGAELSDISGNWAENEILSFVESGYIAGYPDGTFRPGEPVTRAEFARITNSAFNFKNHADVSFKDVLPGSWYYDDVSYAVAAGYILGYTDGTFKPNNNITRAEASVIIQRILQIPLNTAYASSTFSDVPANTYYNGAVGALTNAGIMKGITDRMFGPDTQQTRADTVYSLYNALYNPSSKENIVINGNVIVNESSYGPSSTVNVETVSGDVTIKSSHSQTVVSNLSVKGDFIVEETARRVYLRNVSIDGQLIINGGTLVSLDKSSVYNVHIENRKEAVRFEIDEYSAANNVNVLTTCFLTENANIYSGGISSVVIDEKADDKISVTLNGRFVAVDVYKNASNVVLQSGSITDLYFNTTAEDSKADIKSGTTVELIDARARRVSIAGAGKIVTAKIEASNVLLDVSPEKLTGAFAPVYSSDIDSYNLNFYVVNRDNVPVSGATVILNNTRRTTDDQGKVTYTKVINGTYDYSVTADDFITSTGTVTVSSKTTDQTVKLDSNYSYWLTLYVEDSVTGGKLDSAYIDLKNMSTAYTSNGQARFTDVYNGTYTYTVSRSGYSSVTDTVKVESTNTTKTVRLVPNAQTYSVTFDIKNESGASVSGAIVTIGSKTGTANSNGAVTVSGLTAGTYTYSVSAANYSVYTKSVTVPTVAAQLVTLSQNLYTAQISVIDGNGAVEGATVKLGELTVLTDDNGVAEFLGVPGGTHAINITKSGYAAKADSIIIDGNNQTIKSKTVTISK